MAEVIDRHTRINTKSLVCNPLDSPLASPIGLKLSAKQVWVSRKHFRLVLGSKMVSAYWPLISEILGSGLRLRRLMLNADWSIRLLQNSKTAAVYKSSIRDTPLESLVAGNRIHIRWISLRLDKVRYFVAYVYKKSRNYIWYMDH